MSKILGPAEAESLTRQIRAKIIAISCQAGTPHLASALSTVELLTAAYWNVMDPEPIRQMHNDRDRFIFSKGHAAPALYVALAMRGIIPEALLDTFCQPGSALSEQPTPHAVAGLEAATGSLGHGLPMGVGMALGAKLKQLKSHVFVLMSDGECNEGSIWEAAMLAPAQKLTNLMLMVDFNKWQATGRSCDVLALEPLRDKFASFGWHAVECDGHDIAALTEIMQAFRQGEYDRPVALIAHTVKGKGISFMEDDNNWHYRVPQPEDLQLALEELGVTL